MIWLTWRQFRIQAIAGLAVLAAVAAVFVSTRSGLSGMARDSGYLGCTADCDKLAAAFLRQAESSHYAPLYYAGLIVQYLIPALVGLFWGAPLVARELETGTHRLVWSQTVTRDRWLAVKLAGVGIATAALSGLVSLTITWWASVLDRAGSWMSPDVFAARGIVPIGYAAFAFIVGVTLGMLLRRTVVAMAVSLVVVAAALVAAPLLREHLAQASTYAQPLTADFEGGIGISRDDPSRNIRVFPDTAVPGAWVLNSEVVDAAGRPYHGPYDPAYCGLESTAGPQGCKKWLADQNLTHTMVYLGRNTFWTLQWRELGVFLGISALLAIFCFWWIRRRVA